MLLNYAAQATLPSADGMKRDIELQQQEMAARYKASARHTIQVDYVTYCEVLADLVGCRPSFWSLLLTRPMVRRFACFVLLFFASLLSFFLLTDAPTTAGLLCLL